MNDSKKFSLCSVSTSSGFRGWYQCCTHIRGVRSNLLLCHGMQAGRQTGRTHLMLCADE
jgi:hypothetical protein